MGNYCGCGCEIDHNESKETKTPEDKVMALKKAIANLGYDVSETANGEIRISQSE